MPLTRTQLLDALTEERQITSRLSNATTVRDQAKQQAQQNYAAALIQIDQQFNQGVAKATARLQVITALLDDQGAWVDPAT